MKLKTKILIDRFIGRILCFCFGLAALLLGRILSRDHGMEIGKIKTIVVAKYYGMGSITHSIPTLKALKEKYPHAKIVFITRKSNREFVELIEYIDEPYYIDDGYFISFFISNIKLLLKLWSLKVDLFFDLEVFSSYGALMGLFSLTRNRFGFFFPHSAHFKSWIYSHLIYFNFQMPLRLSYMQLARLGGADIDSSTDLIAFNLPEEIRLSAKNKLENFMDKKSRGLLAINVNASELSFSRRWRIENFAKTAQVFASKGYCVLLLGSPGEKEYVEKVLKFVGDNYEQVGSIYNAAGFFSLYEVLALFDFCDAFLTNDSGLMNLACTQNAKIVALYGANVPQFVHIDNGINTVIYKKAYCSP
ncbi:MAG: glycosyltransferase family 9 protein, partial [Elusimicrobiota bacterium]|nr:glycosyltransferase family 9 protein [Elusimicrobiota bacterium]